MEWIEEGSKPIVYVAEAKEVVVLIGTTTEKVLTTEEIVREYFADIPVMIKAAECESTFRQFNEDGSVLRGWMDHRDTGVMQINTYYHGSDAAKMGIDIETLEGNLKYALHLYETQGVQPWSASFPCMGI